MTDPEKNLALTADFPAKTREDWRERVEAALKGTPFERLASRTYDAIAIAPLAPRRPDALPVAVRPGGTPWQVLARIDHPDPALANEAARNELNNGAGSVALVFAGAIGAYGFGLPPTEEALARALEGIDVAGGVAIEFDLSPHAEAAIDAVLAKGVALPHGAKGLRIGHDPLGAMARTGAAARPWREEAPRFARRLTALARDGLQKLAAADGRVIHNAGGSEAQELAFTLAAAVGYLRALESAAVALDAARRLIFFRLSADTDQLLTIAKFRALRKLWARIEASCGLNAEPAFVCAETAWRMMAKRDPHTNILRATIAAFAGAIGGADAVSVLPFTAAIGLPDAFARRIARNAQLIVLEEAHLDQVIDPGAGSGAIEDLTDQLCRAAWSLFQEIEAAGGIAAALESGLIQGKVAAVRAQRAAAVACREDALTGVSIFPALQEPPAAVLQKAPPDLAPAAERPAFAPLLPMRLAEPFETLRDMSDQRLAETGARPKVFLAALGRQADYTARASFAANFFEAGGIEAIIGEGTASTMSSAFKASGVVIACLCGTEEAYSAEAADAAAALTAAGARHIYLAGQPGPDAQRYRDVGVQTFIHEGCDAPAILGAAYRLIAS